MIKTTLFNLKNMIISPYHMIKDRGGFVFDGNNFRYFIHWYNHTWNNCRRVEIPIFIDMYFNNAGKKMLEVGNVLGHYILVDRRICDVLDKYDKAKGVINEDILTFNPSVKYDVVLSCSTLEHVGFDKPEVENPSGFLEAMENIMKNVLAPSGVFVFSVPFGYNPGVDRVFDEGLFHFDNVIHCMLDNWDIAIVTVKSKEKK